MEKSIIIKKKASKVTTLLRVRVKIYFHNVELYVRGGNFYGSNQNW